jgi:GNAT superfamily N-acetyltransferase
VLDDATEEGQNCRMPIIRAAVRSDADGIGEAHAEAWRVGYADLFPADQLEAAVDLRRRMWSGLVGGSALPGTLLVAEEDRDVLGFIHFGVSAESPRLGEVFGFYVHPSSWGSGTGRDLMAPAVTSMADSFDRAVLWTHSDAGRAQRFYAKSGWTRTGNEHRVSTWDGLEYPAIEYERLLGPGNQNPVATGR